MMATIRVTLTSKSGLGSQSWLVDSYKAYGNFILDSVKKREDYLN